MLTPILIISTVFIAPKLILWAVIQHEKENPYKIPKNLPNNWGDDDQSSGWF